MKASSKRTGRCTINQAECHWCRVCGKAFFATEKRIFKVPSRRSFIDVLQWYIDVRIVVDVEIMSHEPWEKKKCLTSHSYRGHYMTPTHPIWPNYKSSPTFPSLKLEDHFFGAQNDQIQGTIFSTEIHLEVQDT